MQNYADQAHKKRDYNHNQRPAKQLEPEGLKA